MPFIYSQDDVDALLVACDEEFAHELVAATVRTVIGLLAATGLRISEALNLRVDDIDVARDVLVIKAAKSDERLVPVHPTTTAALGEYLALPVRAATRPDPHGPVFVTAKATGYAYVSFQHLFKRVRTLAQARDDSPQRFSSSVDPKILDLPDVAWINTPIDQQQEAAEPAAA